MFPISPALREWGIQINAPVHGSFGTFHLIILSSNEGSVEPAQIHILASALAVRMHKVWVYRKAHLVWLDTPAYSPRASNTFNQVFEAKRFEGVFLCRKVR